MIIIIRLYHLVVKLQYLSSWLGLGGPLAVVSVVGIGIAVVGRVAQVMAVVSSVAQVMTVVTVSGKNMLTKYNEILFVFLNVLKRKQKNISSKEGL